MTKIYLLIGTSVAAFVLGILENIFVFHYKKYDKKVEQNKLAKEQADKEYKLFKDTESQMPEMFDSFRKKFKKDSEFRKFISCGGSHAIIFSNKNEYFFDSSKNSTYQEKMGFIKAKDHLDDLIRKNYITTEDKFNYCLNDSFVELLLK